MPEKLPNEADHVTETSLLSAALLLSQTAGAMVKVGWLETVTDAVGAHEPFVTVIVAPWLASGGVRLAGL